MSDELHAHGGMNRVAPTAQNRAVLRRWDWLSVLLTVALVQIASARLAVSGWVPTLAITETVSLYAVTLGLVLGASQIERKYVVWFVIEYGLLLIPLQLLYAIDNSANSLEALRTLSARLGAALYLFAQNKPVNDNLLFVFVTALGFWIAAAYAGYQLTRHTNFLRVVIGPGIIILLIQVYDPWVTARIWAVAAFFFVALALLSRLQYLSDRIDWQEKHMFLPNEVGWDLYRRVLIGLALMVFVAWMLPSALTNVKPAAQAWRNFTQPLIDRLSNAVHALQSPYGAAAGDNFYGTSISLGTNAPTSDAPAFYVEVLGGSGSVPRYYWRGRTYDHYQSGNWTASGSTSEAFDPLKDSLESDWRADRSVVILKMMLNVSRQELLYGPSEIVWVDHAARVLMNTAPADDGDAQAWVATPALNAGDGYQVRAWIANPTVEQLRAAGVQYPEQITKNYLQVPRELQAQLNELAQNVAEGQSTPYDETQAVTSYLRKAIAYKTQIDGTPPAGEDPLLWVLFERHEGFCMYYASAEVLMLRTLGIPARMAAGFAEGTFDARSGRYVVTRKDSHAWPEVYFPGIGWVEFEPTANQGPVDRPEIAGNTSGAVPSDEAAHNPRGALDEQSADSQNPGNDQTTPAQPSISWTRVWTPALIVIALALAIYLFRSQPIGQNLPVYLAERYARAGSTPPAWLSNWAAWAALVPIERAFQIINVSLNLLGERQPASRTPAERAEKLADVLPGARESIAELLREYQSALYTTRGGDLPHARRAAWNILIAAARRKIFG